MHGFMNVEALKLTIETKEAHYWSRSRKEIWHKGKTSGFVQKIKEIRIDDDQDSVWLSVDIGDGSSCHVGIDHVSIDQYRLEKLIMLDKFKWNLKKKKKNLILMKFIKINPIQQKYNGRKAKKCIR